jgi:hypothetical protein
MSQTGTLSYTDTGLSAGTLYSYTIAAFDAMGKMSAQTIAVSVTTAAASTLPDLIVWNLVAGSSLIAAGQSTPVTATVQNIGAGSSGSSMVAFKEMGMTLYIVAVPALSAGESAQITQSMGSAPNIAAIYRWYATADSTGVITEKYEDNNISTEVNVSTFISASSTAFRMPKNTQNNLAAIAQALNAVKQQLLKLLQELLAT